MSEQFETKLKQLIMKNSKLRIGFDDIEDNSEIVNDFGYDSVTTVKLILDIEEEFNIEFNDAELSFDKIGKYQDLKGCVLNIVNAMK